MLDEVISMKDTGATYLLTTLLPRLEASMPGLLDDLAAGVCADRQAIVDAGKMTPEIEEVFRSVAAILGRGDR